MDKGFKHGLSKHPLYGVHSTMIQRCYNKKYKCFKNYGARGIGICEEWKGSFMIFYNWAISNGWQKGLTLDRINNNEGYSPDNCRYVSYTTNLRNRRSNNLITKDGITKCLQGWADSIGVSAMTIYYRMKRGLPIDEVLSSEKFHRGRRKKAIAI